MDWQAALRARLLAAAGVTALVAQRIYWVERPQLAALPAITLQAITELHPQHMADFDNLKQATVQIDAWSTTYGNAQLIAQAIKAALAPASAANGIRFEKAFINSIRDLGERTETQFIHRASLDMIFHYNTI